MTDTNTIDQLITSHNSIAEEMASLQIERGIVRQQLIENGIEADEQIRQQLQAAASKAQQALADLDQQISQATAHQAELDQRIDAGDDTVAPLEAMEADIAVRTAKGKRKPIEAEAQRAQRALSPFAADNHLALLAAETVGDLVDVPVLIRKRAGDVQGITDAVILSQTEFTEGYGTVRASGRVRFTELGSTGLDRDKLEDALRDTGADVSVYGDVIDYEQALWPVPRLAKPSLLAVTQFDEAFSQTYQAVVSGPTRNRAYASYKTIWHTTKTTLDETGEGEGEATGTISALFGIEREYAPLNQMRQFIDNTLAHFSTGVHTSAGVLEEITVVEVKDLGLWVPEGEPYIHGRQYDGKFGVTFNLKFRYVPVEV